MRRVRMLCLFCVASSSLTGSSMAQYPAPANTLPTYHAPHTTHAAHHAPTFAPFATADTVPPNPVPQLPPQPNRGRPINAWSTAPAAVYVSPFQNSPTVNSSPGFAFPPQPVTAPQTFAHGPMGPAALPHGQPSNFHFTPHPTLQPASNFKTQPVSFANSGFPAQLPSLAPQPQHFTPYPVAESFAPHAELLMQAGLNPAGIQPTFFPNSGPEESVRPLSAGHSFQNVRHRNQTPAAAATPIHVYPPNIRLKN